MGKSAGDRERSGGHQWREQVVRRALEKLLASLSLISMNPFYGKMI